MAQQTTTAGAPDGTRALLWTLAAATFLIFFQAFMVAPLIPRLADLLDSSTAVVGLAVPAYLLPYGAMTLVWGPLSDRLGRGPVILASLAAFVVLSALSSAVHSASAFVAVRLVTALGASGVVPISLALIGDAVPMRQRGQALGLFFGAMAAGIAFGSSAGAILEPAIGWRGLFLGVSGLAAVVLAALVRRRSMFGRPAPGVPPTFGRIARGYLDLLRANRARRTYAYVFVNAVIHSGIYTWLGLYFERRHGLGEVGIGLALLGYGIPGFVLGPAIGRLADTRGRARLIPAGVALAGACSLALASPVPLVIATLVVALLSLGYDLTQPLLAGIVTQLSEHRGQAMGLNVFTLFVGLGLGALVFQLLLEAGLTVALVSFGATAVVGALTAIPAFRDETATTP